MPKLRENLAAGAMHRLGHLEPTRHLLVGMDAGGADVADALRAYLGRLGDDQAGPGTLGVIGGGERIWHIAFERTAARHRRHHQAVPQLQSSEAIGGQQACGRCVGYRLGIRLAQGSRLLAGHDFLLLTGGSADRVTLTAPCGTGR